MIRVRWHGHSCFEISNGRVIVLDPHDGTSIGIPPPKVRADIIVISHDHFDHNQARVVEKESSVKVRESKEVEGVKIEGIRAYHDKEKGSKRGEITIFKIEFEGMKFCHMGDIGHVPDDETIKKIGKVDMIFIPVGGVFTVDAREAMEIAKKVDARIIVPMHYKIEGLSLPINPLEPFLDLADFDIRYVANEIEMERDDIPEGKEIWVFSL
ncbi:MAG: MBL fold metallo-hydrolase [Thermoplasmata archaeon]|nr:MBL fold metallo-hydrolase [Thermoplasmata archaeon]